MVTKAEKKKNNLILLKWFEQCSKDMQDLSDYFIAYINLVNNLSISCNKSIEDDLNTWKENLNDIYGLYGCLEDEFCYLCLYDKTAPNQNKRREYQKDFLETNYEYLMNVESKKSIYSISMSQQLENAMNHAENIQKELFEVRQFSNKNNLGYFYYYNFYLMLLLC